MKVDDYSTPTRIKRWLQATASITSSSSPDDKRQAYGQWIAQLLQVQLGIPLVKLYTESPLGETTRTVWPITLSDEAFAAFEAYFAQKTMQVEAEQQAGEQPAD